MGTTCPKCGAGIDQDFGLVNCPGCGTVLAVDVEGNVQLTESSPSENFSESAQSSEAYSNEPVEAEFQDLHEMMEGSLAETSTNAPTVDASAMEELPSVEEALSSSQKNQENENQFLPTQEIKEQSLKEALGEIRNYGNKDSSTGPFNYTIIIDGIDLATTRGQLQEIFSKPQFGWDAKEMMKRIKGGTLSLEGLSSAQTVMLLRLLRGTKVQTSWSQHVYS